MQTNFLLINHCISNSPVPTGFHVSESKEVSITQGFETNIKPRFSAETF